MHVAIIMDGNGRWAEARGLPRTAGHRQGAEALRRVLEVAPELDIETLTVFAMSSDNWQRPGAEVRLLLRLLRDRLRSETEQLRSRNIRISFIGRRDRLPLDLCDAIERAECATAGCGPWHLRVALDYSSRDAIIDAACKCAGRPITREAISHLVAGGGSTPEVDLLIRTGGEQRLSDFLLWELAYAELYFTPVLWPDFSGEDLSAAIHEFRRRDRRFGALSSRETAGAFPSGVWE